MKLSKYNIYKNINNNKYTWIWNTFHYSQILITNEALNLLKEGFFDRVDSHLCANLITNGILIDNDVNEQHLFEQRFMSSRFSFRHLSLYILTTYCCNLNCAYCFQGQLRNTNRKIFKTARGIDESIYKFIRNYLTRYQIESLRITFYGGEPTLVGKKLNVLAKNIKLITSKERIPTAFEMFSNGTLLHRFKKFLCDNIVSLFITLDGSENIHNQRRPFKNGSGSFRTIIKNCAWYSKSGNLKLNVICDLHNISSLLNNISEFDVLDRKTKIYLSPTLANHGNNEFALKNSFLLNNGRGLIGQVKEKLRKMGFTVRAFIEGIACSALFPHRLLVDTLGDLYKCNTCAGYKKDFYLGNINDINWLKFESKVAGYVNLMPWSKNKQCIDCALLPACHGGCMVDNMVREGDIYSKSCNPEQKIESLIPLVVENM